MTDRFDQKPGEPYARCVECEFTSSDQPAMGEHSRTKKHRYRVTNPTREEALRREVEREAEDALEAALDEFTTSLYRLHEREGVAMEEIAEAIKRMFVPDPDFAEAWKEFIA